MIPTTPCSPGSEPSSSSSDLVSPRTGGSTGSRYVSWSPEPISNPPPSPSSLMIRTCPMFDCELMSFDRYTVTLFKSALGEDKKAVNALLLYPLFKDRVFDVLPKNPKYPNRISVLRYLAHHHINTLEKDQVKDLIRAVGVSNYVMKAPTKKVESLYRNLFSYGWTRVKERSIEGSHRIYLQINIPSSGSFSKEELLEFESEANETLRAYISEYIKKRFPPLT